MTDVQTSQFKLALVSADDSSPVRTSQYALRVVYNFPSEAVETSGYSLGLVSTNDNVPAQVSQFRLRYVYKGRVADPKVRCFTFTLDGHDYYVVRLGTTGTLIFDTQTEQFYIWGSGSDQLWRAYDGCNWLGGYTQASVFGSNIVVGDDGNGSIYFLDPDSDQDDDAIQGADLKRDYLRQASGQLVTKGYSFVRCYGLELLGSIGQFSSGTPATVTLMYSDDRGQTYVDAGAYSVDPDDYQARLFWRSLGSVRAPGRIFKILDYGALKRIDSLTMIGDEEGKT